MSLSLPTLFAFSLRDRLAVMSWLELVLWIGLASLTVALLILMGTRWGQVRPVSKCVALSVFAHILFAAYAYGTKLSFDGVGLGIGPTVQVSLSDAGEEGEWDSPPSQESVTAPADLGMSPRDLSFSEPPASKPESPPMPRNAVAMPEDVPESPPALLATPEPAPTQPPPLLPDPDLFDPSETIAEPIEIVSTPLPTPPVPEDVPEPAVEIPSDPMPSQPSEVATVNKPAPPDPALTSTVEPTKSDNESAPSAESDPATTYAVANADTPRPSRRPVDNQPLPEVYRMRGAENRLQLAFPFGATQSSEAAVQAALAWLASTQSPDGHWDAKGFGAGHETKALGQDRQGAGETADTGITGLALLAFLGSGNTHVQGNYRETVQRGLEFLLRSQADDGHLAGPARVFEKMYCHGIATLALGEAMAMTGDARLQPALRRAIGYSVTAQHPVSGGWRYQPGDRGDISQFGWQVMALRSADLGGLPVDERTRSLMLKFLESATSGRNRGLASYRPGERPTRTMTAEAMACRFFLETPPNELAAREASEFVLQELPGRGQSNLYFWYYATMALFQEQGPAWPIWNEALQQNLIARQRREGRATGSWDTDDVWGGYGGRVYTTAMGALCLEVYYRYLPLYQTDETRQADADRFANPVRR